MPECSDEARRSLVLQLSRDAVVMTAQVLFEKAVATTDSKLLRNSLEMLTIALERPERPVDFSGDCHNQRVYVTDDRTPMLLQPEIRPGQKVYVSKGAPCSPGDCEKGCLWLPICENEQTHTVIEQNRQAIAEAEASLADAERGRQIRRAIAAQEKRISVLEAEDREYRAEKARKTYTS